MEEKQRKQILQSLPPLLLEWYDRNKRDLPWRKDTDPYRVWISEIMLQQTRVEAAREHYIRFLRELPTVQALADCPEDKLLKLWEGLGYYSRARNLQKAAAIVAKNGFPHTAAELKKLPGIGEYTAGAIASICFEESAPAVDGNVVRVLSRVLADGRSQDTLKKVLAEELSASYPPARRGDYTQSLMELGATVCLPSSPLCLTCPLLCVCEAKSDAFPLRKEKPKRRIFYKTLFVFCDKTRIALYRREEGVLRGTYAFFSIGREMDKGQAEAFLRLAGLKNFSLGSPLKHTHVFSHLEWHMTAYTVYSEEDAAKLTLPAGESADAPFSALFYAERSAAKREFSLPSAYRWALPPSDGRKVRP